MADTRVERDPWLGRLGLRFRSAPRLTGYRVAVVIPSLVVISAGFASSGITEIREENLASQIVFWMALVAIMELLPVPAWRSLRMSVALPLFMAVAFLYSPWIAGAITLVGSTDPREFRGEVSLLHTLFNRCQGALAVLAASAVFHGIADGVAGSSIPALLPAAALAVLADYSVNALLVSIDGGLMHGVPFRQILSRLRIGNRVEFVVSYLGLGFLGVLLARLHIEVGAWAVAAFVMPLLLARQMFFRTRALEDAAKALKDREKVLRTLSNRMAEEREDERIQIAGYLHDDVAQLLYRLSLHIDISEKHLRAGSSDKAGEELSSIRTTKDRTLQRIRSMIKDLHRSPLGRAGLVEAISSFCIDIENDLGIRFRLDLEEIDMPPPIQLLCYQVTREAINNIVKHAQASNVRVTLEPTPEGGRVTIVDDGVGFEAQDGSPEGHFGLTMMKERASIGGGSLTVESAPGEGTTLIADFTTAWLEEEADESLGLGADEG